MKTYIQNLFITLAFLASLSQTARAADVSSYFVAKRQFFKQTNSGPAVFQDPSSPYTFDTIVNANASSLVLGFSLKLPNGTSQSGTAESGGYFVGSSFPTLVALDTAYPAGQYVLTITNANDGIKIVTNNLPASVYPSTPHVSNYDAAQQVNPLADFPVTSDAFTNGTTSDLILFKVSGANGNTVFTRMLKGLANSVVIPGSTLTADGTYSARLTFDKIINIDTASYPGATGKPFSGCSQISLSKLPIRPGSFRLPATP